MTLASVDEIISRMILAAAAKNQQEMIEKTGLSDGIASKWRKRGNVPESGIYKVAQVTGVSFEWLKTGEGSMRPPPTTPTLIVAPSYTGPDRRATEPPEPTSIVAEAPFLFTTGPPKLTQTENRLLVAFRGLTEQQQEDKLTEMEVLAQKNESRGKLGGGSI